MGLPGKEGWGKVLQTHGHEKRWEREGKASRDASYATSAPSLLSHAHQLFSALSLSLTLCLPLSLFTYTSFSRSFFFVSNKGRPATHTELVEPKQGQQVQEYEDETNNGTSRIMHAIGWEWWAHTTRRRMRQRYATKATQSSLLPIGSCSLTNHQRAHGLTPVMRASRIFSSFEP